MKRYFVLTGLFLVFLGCGKKFPLPEESNEGMPSEKDYVEIQNTQWDNLQFNHLKDIFLGEDGYVYLISGDTLSEDTVYSFSVTGEYGNVFAKGNGFVSLSQDNDENLYIATKNGFVIKYRWDGVVLDTFDFQFVCTDTVYKDSFLTSIDAISDNDFVLSFAPLNLVLHYHNESYDTVATYGTGIEYTRNPHGVYGRSVPGIILYASTDNNWVEGLSLSVPHYSMIHLGGDSYNGGSDDTLFLKPVDVYMDDSSYVYVLDGGNMAMKKFDFEGDIVTVLHLDEKPVAFSVSHDGKTLYIAFTERVKKYRLPEIPGEGGEQ